MNIEMNRLIEMTKKEIDEIECAVHSERYGSLSDYDKGYLDGDHDRAVCLLDQLHVSHNYQIFDKNNN